MDGEVRAKNTRLRAAAPRAEAHWDRSLRRRAAHGRFLITSVDGVEREVAVTAFPLFAHTDEFVGIVTIFWRE
mgnify:CR=1 FL=1